MKHFQSLICVVIVLAAVVLGCSNPFSPGWRASEACRYLEETGLETVAYTQKENRAHTCFERGLIKNDGRVTTRPADKNYQAQPGEASIEYYAWGGFNSFIADELNLYMHTGESDTATEFQKDFLRFSEPLYQKAIGSPLPAEAREYILSPPNNKSNLFEIEPQDSKVKNARVKITKQGYGIKNEVINMRMQIFIPEY